jgi:hypothetical protein
VSIDRNHPLAKDCVALWMASEGQWRDYAKFSDNNTSPHDHNATFQTAHCKISPTDLGLAMELTPTAPGQVAANNGWAATLATTNATEFNTTNGSIEFWFRLKVPPASGADNQLLLQRADTSNGNGIIFYVYWIAAGQYGIGTGVTASWGFNLGATAAAAVIRANTWHHGVMTFASSGTSALYLDGTFLGTDVRASSFAFNGQAVRFGSHDGAAGFWGGFNGFILKSAWYRKILDLRDVKELARSPMAMLRGPDMPFFAAGLDPSSIFYGDFADTMTWAPSLDPPGDVAQSLLLSDAFIAGDTASVVDESISDTLAWTPNMQEDQGIFDTLSWSGDEEATFTLPDVYDTEADTLHWADRFTSNSDELSNGRYRR